MPKRSLALLALLLAFVSCFEPPVREDLRLRFLPNGAFVATSTVEITDPQDSNPALARRLAATRQAALDGTDAWGSRFASLEPGAERFSWEKRLGEVHKATHSAVVMEPESLARFFSDTSLAVSYTVRPEDGTAELTIASGPSARATRTQRKEMERTLGTWSGDVKEYLAATQKLYDYLDEHPDRAEASFSALFEDLLPEGRPEGKTGLSAEEQRLVERLSQAMEEVLDVLLIPTGADHSPDEISRLVYDPFPARLTVTRPAPPLEVEGFERKEGGELTVPGFGLWDALQSLEGRWVSPDPVLVYVKNRGREDSFDLDTFLGQPRRAEPAPTAQEVRQAIETQLSPEPFYRLTWTVEPDDETPFTWEEKETR
ncbi:MAG TPA: hypothetical protein VLQ45_12900 [Thermoanaerobaculia bacterium]|nr:hypothetical protein [Thermoanaerobaculia bacterium]